MQIEDLEERAEEASQLLAAMANPKRLALLCALLDDELSVGDLATRVGLAQSPLSQHLAKLRAMRLVATRRDGQLIYYRLASDAVARVLETLHGIYCPPPPAAKAAPARKARAVHP